MHPPLEEGKAPRLHLTGYRVGFVFDATFWCDVEGKIRGALVDVPFEAGLVALVESEEEKLWYCCC